ncbi:MAG: hypothetical protein QW587_07325 [Candidatus Bathyarchaeia archaeon]
MTRERRDGGRAVSGKMACQIPLAHHSSCTSMTRLAAYGASLEIPVSRAVMSIDPGAISRQLEAGGLRSCSA